MKYLAKGALGLAAVLLVALTLNLPPGLDGIAGVATPAPTRISIPPNLTPAPTGTPSPTHTPIARPSPSIRELTLPAAGPLTAGTHHAVSESDRVPFSFTVPEGWRSSGWFLTNHVPSGGPFGLRVTFVSARNLYVDPCYGGKALAAGTSVADLATALTALPGTTLVKAQDAVIASRNAKLVEFEIDLNIDCSGGQYLLWRDPDASSEVGFYAYFPYFGTVRTWIVDVDGSRFVIVAEIQGRTSETDKAELQDVIHSVTFP